MEIEQFDIFWVNLNPTKGSEIKKTRPCVVVSPNAIHQNIPRAIIVPATQTVRKLFPFRLATKIDGKTASLACDQMRATDISRFGEKIGRLSKKDKEKLSRILQTMFAV